MFINCATDRTANGISKIVLDKISEWKCDGKIVSQTYDGAAVMSSELEGVQKKKVRDVHKNAIFIHCLAHILNLVLQ